MLHPRTVSRKDWPIGKSITDKISLSALIEGFSTYSETLRDILKHPLKFPETIDLDAEDAFTNGFTFALYAVILLFFLLVPVFAKHAYEASKVAFLLRYLVQFTMYAVLLHVGLRMIGRCRRDLRSTSVVYSYIAGMGAPLGVILLYPILLPFGPGALFGTEEDMLRLALFFDHHPGIAIYMTITNGAVGVLAILITVSWFSRTHQVSKFRIVLSLLLSGLLGSIIQIYILHPVFLVAFEWLDELLKYA